MNTEKINTYKQVVEALKVVNSFRTYDNVDSPERAVLDEMALVLEALSWEIISDDISKVLDSMTLKLTDLKRLNKKINDSYVHLKSVSNNIAKVTEVVGVLVEIITKAISAGIL